jgi:hypothetical protein
LNTCAIYLLKNCLVRVSTGFFLLFFYCSSFFSTAFADAIIHYPRADSAEDERVNYYSQLLQLCLAKSGKSYQIEPSVLFAEQARGLQLVETNRGLDVIWAVTTKEREEKLMPIRIPLDRGLFGWRIFLIKASDQPLFNNVETSEQLATLRTGQGHDWPDTDILRANHFSISGSTSYEGLFDMLARNHIQYFPRSPLEADLELNAHPHHGLAIESQLVLHYPAALYFFVNKKNIGLATDLEKGLANATVDGSFKKLFDQHFSAAIRKYNLSQRKVISIDNPLLPANTPLAETQYWFSAKDNY